MTGSEERAPYRRGSETAWAAARADYLAGRPAEEVCERHGLGLSALRKRAQAEGWRRCDQPPQPAEEEDDLFDGEMPDPSWLADEAVRRLGRAVIRGRVREARSWALVVRDLRRLAEDEVRAHQELEQFREDHRAGLIHFPGSDPGELALRTDEEAAEAEPERASPLAEPEQPSPAPPRAQIHAFHPVFPTAAAYPELQAARAGLLAALAARAGSLPSVVHSRPTPSGTTCIPPVDGIRLGFGSPHGRGPPVPCPDPRPLPVTPRQCVSTTASSTS